MNSGVIDHFLSVFTQYIDTGFGLLGPEVNYLARTLVLIDITLAALFWSWAADEDIMARLVKKTLFVGVFAYLIGNWQTLAKALFESFAALGLKASATGLTEADFLRPGRVAQVGLDAGQPILQSVSGLIGFVSFFQNFIQITVLLFAWAVVLISFFVLAIQLFVSLIEFRLSTLCGFVLSPLPHTPSSPATAVAAELQSIFRSLVNEPLPSCRRALRAQPGARNTLPARCRGLGRPHRLRPRAGPELAPKQIVRIVRTDARAAG